MDRQDIEKVAILSTEQSRMAKDIAEIKDSVKELSENIKERFDRLEGRFAAKWVERVVKWVVGLILVTVFGAMMSKVVL